jgi:hypothetical protein
MRAINRNKSPSKQLENGLQYSLLGLAILAMAARGQAMSGPIERQTEMDDPYFQTMGCQLIEPPESSRAALLAIRGPVPSHAEFPIENARSWVYEVLKEPYRPAEELSFRAIPSESGGFDVVRAVYRAGGLKIEVAQTRNVFSLRFRNVYALFKGTDEERAEELARKVFHTDLPIHFRNDGAFVLGRSHGPRVLFPRADPSWPHWMDELRFWTDGTDIGFMMLKAGGGPTREVIMPLEGANRHWFLSEMDEIAPLDQRLPDWARSIDPEALVDYSSLRQAVIDFGKISPAGRREAVAEYSRKYCIPKLDLEKASGMYVFLRVVFDVPERYPNGDAKVFGSWMRSPVNDSDKYFDLSWPVQIRDNSLRMQRFNGYFGKGYDCLGEYDYFLEHFKFRDPLTILRLTVEE